MSDAPVEIHIISDSTGDTASRVARAAQAQFSASPVNIVRHPRVTTLDGLQAAFAKIRSNGRATVFFTLIDRALREGATELCERHGFRRVHRLRPQRHAGRGQNRHSL